MVFQGTNPAAFLVPPLAFVSMAVIDIAQRYSPEECKARVCAAKQIEIQRRIEELRRARQNKEQSEARQGPDIFGAPDKPAPVPGGNGAFGGVFASSNRRGGDDN